jgi:glycolate oxidase iron-sulfur subunit
MARASLSMVAAGRSDGLKLARSVRWALPTSLRNKVGGPPPPAGEVPTRVHNRKVLVLRGCVQTSMLPSIDAATARVLDVVGVQTVVAPGSGCCGAIRQHLDDQAGARDDFRRNIDAWWPFIESGQVEAIVINASGCGATVKEYGHLLSNDPAYAGKARRIVEMTRDLAEFVPDELAALGVLRLGATPTAGQPPAGQASAPGLLPRKVAFHPPCTLQHGLKVRGKVESLLASLGAQLVPVRDAHICCGSAGTYSVLQPHLSGTLRAQKLDALLDHQPGVVLSANIGCISHLQGGTRTPVRHWIEWVDEALVDRGSRPMSQIGKKA